MLPPFAAAPSEAEDGWQVVSPEWWRIPFSAVSWAYAADPKDAGGLSGVAKPPHYHDALFRIRVASLDDRHDEDLADWDDGLLNPDLVGVKGAVDAVASYEIDVGFHWSSAVTDKKTPPDLRASVNENQVALCKEQWDELVQDLTGGLSIDGKDRYHDSDEDSSYGLHRSTSTLSSIDLTDSERSVASVSMPATPKARRSYANIVVKNVSPSRSSSSRDSDRSALHTSPPRRLNASASLFVPSPVRAKLNPVPYPSLSPPPTSFTNFVFPSLDVPPLPVVKIKKDEQGFYSEVEAPPTPPPRTSSMLLPSFLHDAFHRRRAPASKTRAIVDRLKSSGLPQTQREPVKSQVVSAELDVFSLPKPRLSVSEHGGDGDSCLSSPAVDDDRDGWIGGDEGELKPAPSLASSKTRRTRELFLALTRRRSNSSPPKSTLVAEPPADDVIGITVLLPSPSPSPAPSSNDGWIEGPSLLLPEAKPAKAPPVRPHPRQPKRANAKPRPPHPPPTLYAPRTRRHTTTRPCPCPCPYRTPRICIRCRYCSSSSSRCTTTCAEARLQAAASGTPTRRRHRSSPPRARGPSDRRVS
ncbi:hypothetical protein B0H10DRAFT_492842 [Mycena sp. CBHHK59/15]|nr:hypothetical protein B0H10DRAFT_492842 [Mycena sp. CBHHK59/15]